jgi:ribulose 1,5-bisphosphate synthetase/thiazole synthase
MAQKCLFWALIPLCLALCAAADHIDVVVYGTSASGVAAAIVAARMNQSVLILGPELQLGGMVTGGLGSSDRGFNTSYIGGLSREFFQRACSRDGSLSNNKTCFDFPPSYASAAFNAMIKPLSSHISVMLNVTVTDISKTNSRITAITVANVYTNRTTVVQGKGFIDSSYEGDLMALAGIPYAIGACLP